MKQKRIEEPVALKILNTFSKKVPGIWMSCDNELYKYRKLGYCWDDGRCVMPLEVAAKTAMNNKILRAACNKDYTTPDKLLVLYSWRMSKEIFSFDKILAESLMSAADDNMDIPAEALLNIPFPCIYVDLSQCGFNHIDGFFCCLNHDRISPNMEERNFLANFAIVNKGRIIHQACLPLDNNLTLKEGLDMAFGWVSDSRKAGIDIKKEVEVESNYLAPILQLVMYICTINADITEIPENVNNENKENNNENKNKSCSASGKVIRKWNVGYRIGSCFSKHFNKNESKEAEEILSRKEKLRPHTRRSHFHHYWVGSEAKGTRRLVLKWIAPIYVNVNMQNIDNELPAVIRDVKE